MSAPTGPPPPIPAMDGTLGALAMGAFGSCFFFGITCVQLYLYTQRFPKDIVWNKALVWWCWVIDAVQTAFTCHVVYYFTVTHYANPTVLGVAPYTLCSMSLFEALIGGPVEVFFAIRVYKLSEGSLIGKITTFAILLTAVVHSAFGITFSSISYVHPEFAYWISNLKWDSTTGLTCAAVCDVIIAVAMVYFLSSRRTGFAQSRSLVNKLMLYSVESGALTSICAVVVVVTFLVLPNLVSLGLLFFLPKLYTNSLMAMLNSRQSLREQNSSVNTANASGLRSDHGGKSFGTPMALQDRNRGVEVTVQQEDFRSDGYNTYYDVKKGSAV